MPSAMKKIESASLAVPQVTLAGTGHGLNAIGWTFHQVGNAFEFGGKKCLNGSEMIASRRAKLADQIRACDIADAEIKAAAAKAGVKIETVAAPDLSGEPATV